MAPGLTGNPEFHELESGINLGRGAHTLRTIGGDLGPSFLRRKAEAPEGFTALCVVAPCLIDDGDEVTANDRSEIATQRV